MCGVAMLFRLLVGSVALAFASSALGGEIALTLVDSQGHPVSDAVATVHPSDGVPKGPIRFPWGTAMVQQNIMFNPHVLIVPVGTTVPFPNKDNVRHHVYSFSKPARFELKLFGRDETHSYTFTSTGSVAIGCNIHDTMSGFIKVVDTPFAAKSNSAGQIRIGNIPAGKAMLEIWHPNLKAKDNELVAPIVIGASGTLSKSITLALRKSS